MNQRVLGGRAQMRSHSFRVDKRRRTYTRLISDIHHELSKALSEEHEKRGLTMAEIARVLDCNRSHVSRKLSGESNMTLETLADLAYALDRPVRITLPDRSKLGGDNQFAPITSTSKPATTSIENASSPHVTTNKISANAALKKHGLSFAVRTS